MLAPDTLLNNRYRIIRLLGKGGMGAIYEALDEELRCQVAVKETFAESKEHRRQFKREASLLANLRHPALPKVISHFTLKQGQFLVMEFIPGKDLEQLLKERGSAFSVNDTLHWADVLLDALSYLHWREPDPIIHRDIKPANLKLTPEGEIILLDFGLAKGRVGQMSSQTANESVLGYTPGYAPLEQSLKVDLRWLETLRGLNWPAVERLMRSGTDQQSDLFSLAATLYHLMTGRAPHEATLRAYRCWNGQPDPLVSPEILNPLISPAVAAALMKALALNREDRFATAPEMRRALNAARQIPWAAASVAAPTLLAEEGAPSSPRRETTVVTLKYGVLGKCDGAVRSVAVAPDGKTVASGSNDNAVRLWNAQTGEARVLGHCGRGESGFSYVSSVAFDPRGQTLVSGSNDSVARLWDVRTGAVRVLGECQRPIRATAFSPDGQLVGVSSSDNAVYLFEVRTGQKRTIGRCEDAVRSVAFSPDGQSIAAEDRDRRIMIWNLKTLEARALDLPRGDVRSFAFSPDGRRIVVGGWDHRVYILNIATNEMRMLGACDDVVRAVGFSPDGSQVISASEDQTIRAWDASSGWMRILGRCADVASAIAITPDGQSIVSGSWDCAISVWKASQ